MIPDGGETQYVDIEARMGRAGSTSAGETWVKVMSNTIASAVLARIRPGWLRR